MAATLREKQVMKIDHSTFPLSIKQQIIGIAAETGNRKCVRHCASLVRLVKGRVKWERGGNKGNLCRTNCLN